MNLVQVNRKSAFTLIELLVVIAIIAILAAILFPVFAQAKVAAKKSASISNSKQIGLAHQLYMGDYDDVFVTSWARGFPGDANFWVQPYMKNLQILMEPNKTVTTSGVASVCANDPYYGSYEMQAGGRDNPTGETFVWGYGINKGAFWMDGTGIHNVSFNPANRGEQIQSTIGGKPVTITVWSTHIGRSATSVVAPASTFFMGSSAELPRMSIQLEAQTPVNFPGLSNDQKNSACFLATHAGVPYAGGNTFIFVDGHVKFEQYNGTPIGNGSLPMVTNNPCRYNADRDPSENYQNCQNGWR